MKRTDLTILQRFWLETLWLGARVFAVMPYWFKYYVVENLLFVLLYYCLRYRMKVVKTNLRNSFPEKSERELAVIRRRFYRTLSEIFVDTINMAYMNEEKGRTVLTVKDVEKHVEAVHGRDWIAMTAHFGCWEYGGEKLALRCNLPVYFVKMNRLRRGRYEMSFELIYDGKEEVAEYEITQRYVRKLERMICECPELWMWSHRRWKHKRTHAGR